MSLLISNAMAAAPASGSAPDSSFSMIMIVAIFVLFYFMLIRPQNKRAKQHRALLETIKKGDEIVTTGGVIGKVVSIDDHFIKVTIAEGVEISLQRSAVSTVLPKGTMKSL